MKLSKKEKSFSQIFVAFLQLTSNFEHFDKKMTFKAYIYSKLRTAKDVVR